MDGGFSGWLFRRASNFILFSVIVFGLPIYALSEFIRVGEPFGWWSLVYLLLAALSGFLWGLFMWVMLVKPKLDSRPDR